MTETSFREKILTILRLRAARRAAARRTEGRRERGFNLIEIMVVLTIISMLMGAVGFSAFAILDRARRKDTRNVMKAIEQAIVQFQTESPDPCPASLSDLTQRKILNKEPQNAVARELLVKNLLLEAGKEGFVTSSGITPKGKQVFQEASEAWMSYLALKPPKPNITLTKDMLRIYGEEGLNQPSQEVGLLQIVVNSEPTNAAYYAGLAEYAYKAHDARLGDLASTKAIALAPAESKKRIQVSLAEVKKNAAKEAKSPSTGGTGAVTATPEGTVTATTSTPTTKK